MDKKHCQIHLCVKSVCAQRAEPLQISQSDKSGEDENVFNESITFRIKLVTFATKLFFFFKSLVAPCPTSPWQQRRRPLWMNRSAGVSGSGASVVC